MVGGTRTVRLSAGGQLLLFALCVLAGATPLCARWIPGAAARSIALAMITIGYAAIAVLVDRRDRLRPYSPLASAFLVLSLVQCGNELVRWFNLVALHQTPVGGNPLASTVTGTVVVQLLETGVAVALVLGLTRLFDRGRELTYFEPGRIRVLLVLSIVVFAFVMVAMARHGSRFIPMHVGIAPARYLALTPTLAVLAISNGFQEEILFRGLFLRRYEAYFPFWAALILQALVFSIAHLSITYSSLGAALFTLLFALPLGLVAGVLMRATKGVLTPSIFHGALDIPIYLAFLSYVR